MNYVGSEPRSYLPVLSEAERIRRARRYAEAMALHWGAIKSTRATSTTAWILQGVVELLDGKIWPHEGDPDHPDFGKAED